MLRKSSTLRNLESTFPVIKPEVNTVVFLRFAATLNTAFSVYKKHPFDFDSRVIAELAGLATAGAAGTMEKAALAR